MTRLFDTETMKKAVKPLGQLIKTAVNNAKRGHTTRVLINEGDEERVRQMLLDAIWSQYAAPPTDLLQHIYIGTVSAISMDVEAGWKPSPVKPVVSTFVKASEFMVNEKELAEAAAVTAAARVRRMTEAACGLFPEEWPGAGSEREALRVVLDALEARLLAIPKELMDESVLEVPKKTRSSSDIFSTYGFPATVLKGVVETDNGTTYFASLGGYLVHRRVAEQFGWITVTNEVEEATDFGHEVYRSAHLDALPRKGRAYLWDWSVVDWVALKKDTE